MAEYCGGIPEATAGFATWNLAGYGGRCRRHEGDGAPVSAPNGEFVALLEEGADVCRSLADRHGIVVQLDVDYTNLRDRSEPYRDPAACFDHLEPVYEGADRVFGRYGIEPFVLLTGRGYHFSFRVPRFSPLYRSLLEHGSPAASLECRYRARADGPEMGRAHDGAGRLLQYLAHEVVRHVDGHAAIPVTLADVAPPDGAPFVCLDLTAYADPIFERHARCAFSANQKAGMTGAAPERPFVINLPREGGDRLADLLRERENLDGAAARAGRVKARLPDVREAALWVEDYRGSRLARFHREFDDGPEMSREAWPFTYDHLDLRTLPDCAGRPLESPNPALLTPVHLRTVALALWGVGWHPRSVAALVRSRYEGDYGWGDLWRRYDPAARAEFYVRLFCGAVLDGIEDPAGFTCDSQAGRGVCPAGRCGWDLGPLLQGVGRP
jgi:hypothetical protein